MRVLVTAASRHSATTEVAQAIASTLENAGLEVTVRRPEEIVDLVSYDAVVVGSAIYAGHWLKPATDLIDRTASRMRTMPVWLFSTGPIGDPLKPDALPVDVAPMLEQSHAREHRLFGGRPGSSGSRDRGADDGAHRRGRRWRLPTVGRDRRVGRGDRRRAQGKRAQPAACVIRA